MSLPLLAALLALPALCARAGTYAVVAEEEPGRVEYLENRNQELKDAVADLGRDSQDVHAMATRLFEAIPDERTTRMPAVVLGGWRKPDRRSEENVESLMSSMQRGLEISEVPPPQRLVDAYAYGQGMRAAGRMAYDEKGDRLHGGTVGAYIYEKYAAVAILYNKAFRLLQRFLGDELAAATAVHEGAHARDHAEGTLNPVEVRKGEKLAFQTEYLWLKAIDPDGQKLCWARVTLGKFSADPAPAFVGEYLEHLAKIRDFGDKGDFDGLVSALGYQDRKASPFEAATPPAGS